MMHVRVQRLQLWLAGALLAGCATSATHHTVEVGDGLRAPEARQPEVVFQDGRAYVRQGDESVRIYRGNRFTWSPGREHLAYVSGTTRQRVEVDGRAVWPLGRSASHRRIIGNLVWSPDGRSLTFLELAGGQPRLVVLLDPEDPDGHLTWPLPPAAASPDNKIFWGESRVVIGESVLNPRYAASWSRLR